MGNDDGNDGNDDHDDDDDDDNDDDQDDDDDNGNDDDVSHKLRTSLGGSCMVPFDSRAALSTDCSRLGPSIALLRTATTSTRVAAGALAADASNA